MGFLRALVIIFNIIFFLCGIGLTVGGVLLFTIWKDYVKIFQDLKVGDMSLNVVAGLILAVGIIVAMISFFGCAGAMCKNVCMLQTFAALMIIIILAQIGAGVLGFVYRSKLQDWVGEAMDRTIKQYDGNTTGTNAPVVYAWNLMQPLVKCCGSTDYKDYTAAGKLQEAPESCNCKSSADSCLTIGSNRRIYSDGCKKKIGSFVMDKIIIIAAIAVSVVLLEILGIVFACLLVRDMKD